MSVSTEGQRRPHGLTRDYKMFVYSLRSELYLVTGTALELLRGDDSDKGENHLPLATKDENQKQVGLYFSVLITEGFIL